jgi:hypothetical protein
MISHSFSEMQNLPQTLWKLFSIEIQASSLSETASESTGIIVKRYDQTGV